MNLTNAIDINVGADMAVKLVDADPKRKILNLFPGTANIWFGGNKNVKAGTIGNKVLAGSNLEITSSAEIWVIRASGDETLCSYSEEFVDG